MMKVQFIEYLERHYLNLGERKKQKKPTKRESKLLSVTAIQEWQRSLKKHLSLLIKRYYNIPTNSRGNTKMITVPKLTLEDAKIILEGAEKKAKEIGVDMDIAVVDDGGNLLAFYRMDKAKITSIDVGIKKAFTAAGARKEIGRAH